MNAITLIFSVLYSISLLKKSAILAENEGKNWV